MHLVDVYLGIGTRGGGAHDAGDDLSRIVTDQKLHVLPLGWVRHKRGQRDDCGVAIYRGGDVEAAAAAIVEIEAGILHRYKIDAAIQPAVEGEIGHLRIDVVALAVVDPDREQVFPLAQRVRHIGAEQRVAALMKHLFPPVDNDLCHAGGGLHLDITVFAGGALNGL